MTSVFISYSSKDRPAAHYIAEALRRRGADDVFVDYQKLIAGDNWMNQLGKEIANRDWFVLIVSPRSADSKWVNKEVAWAMSKDKPIIPIELEPTSYEGWWFLIDTQNLDFTRWDTDRRVEPALRELAGQLGLPADPIDDTPVETPPIHSENAEGETEERRDEVQAAEVFTPDDVRDMLITAAEIRHDDPERAVFLWQQAKELAPQMLENNVGIFIEREIKKLTPHRIEYLIGQAKMAMDRGEWSRSVTFAQDVLILDPDNKIAQAIGSTGIANLKCDESYTLAIEAARQKKWEATHFYLANVNEKCPNYGDPARLLTGETLSVSRIAFVRELTVLQGHSGDVRSLVFSPDNSLLASGFSDKIVRIWDTTNFQFLESLSEFALSLVFVRNNSLQLATGSARRIRIWDVKDWHYVGMLTEHESVVRDLACSPDGALLASASDDNTIKIFSTNNWRDNVVWTENTWRSNVTLRGHKNWVQSVAFSPDGTLLASASDDKTIRLWDVSTWEHIITLKGHEDYVNCVKFSIDGTILISCSGDKTIRLWDVQDLTQKAVLKGHEGAVRNVTVSKDGSILASCSRDQTVRLWDIRSPIPQSRRTLMGHTDAVECIVFSPNDKLLASGSADGTIRLWGLG